MAQTPIPLIAIVGPNASGKSNLAIRLAKTFNGEIISADSRQVYRGLDIGSGKVPGQWRESGFWYRSIRHHCIDIVSPRKTYSVIDFKRCADEAIRDITQRGKIPILVGGTGFWVDVVAHGLELPAVPPNVKLRRSLEKKPTAELMRMLKRLDPERAMTIEPKNPRRLIRAIEIARVLGHAPSIKQSSPYRTLWIGLALPHNELLRRIDTRLHQRIRAGMIREARRLHRDGLSWKRFAGLGLEYRWLAAYLRGRIQRQEFKIRLALDIKRFAGDQIRWFKRNPEIRWIRNSAAAKRLAEQFITQYAREKLR